MSEIRRGEEKVNLFAQAMIDKLNEPQNVAKGGWEYCSLDWLMGRLYVEAKELQQEVERKMSCFVSARDRKEKILKEAADVANFAMMIADKVGALKDEPIQART